MSSVDVTPIIACGANIPMGVNPNIFVEISITHKLSGGLSTVMELPQSEDPKNAEPKFCVPDWTAAL
ncbi:hypothetical protein GCM10007170_13560 [Arthrobacter liuii]|uniref:Uncharacterized protein n=1 Tax=Arthrobacter liuii TaxID=1476996 RepID=A0ABQ2ALG8_9MICC|nr:hypothetical protein GCM10007170_13560 [Arthrobacter liuii]